MTKTLTPAQRRSAAWRSTVALKASMAVSGLIMVLYLLAHMYGNLKVFSGQEAFDEYAHHLRTMGEPILPYEGALWIIRVVLLAAVIVHIFSAVTLSIRAHASIQTHQPRRRYQSTKNRRGVQRTYASFTMRWGGVVIFAFVLYHLAHLTLRWITPGGNPDSPYQRVVDGFEIWWVVLTYTIALLAVGFHLRHGIWSALATLGANTDPKRRRRFNIYATVIALLITIGFLLPPFAILFGWVD